MARTRNIGAKIRRILYESEKRALSAQDVANEFDDFSRQYIDRQLRNMAEGSDSIGRVKIGPSVGYYWNHDNLELFDSEFEGRSIARPSVHGPMPVHCMACDHQLVKDDDVVSIFENTGHQWHLVQHLCSDHLEEEQVDGLIQTALTERYLSNGLEEVGMAFVAVLGTLEEDTFTDQESGREMQTHVLQDTSILQYLRPQEFIVGPEFPSDGSE